LTTPELRIQPAALKDPGETLPVSIDAFDVCAVFWSRNEPYIAAEIVRPQTATGFAYQVTVGGTSGSREPRWPIELGRQVVDGSVTWTCVVAGINGINPIASVSAVSDPAGVTINGAGVFESRKIVADYVGGVLDQDYDVVFSFELEGKPRIARHSVNVRKR
jgi:hypothetical protein